jgi:MOSC domain-containing protein YiiM
MPIGTLAGIFIAPSAKAAMVSVSEVRAIPSRGLEGDRYFHAAGTFSRGHEPDAELTLIEAEAIEALAREQSRSLEPADSRRNLVTRDVALNDLVGREFMVGEVRVLGHRLCEPCQHLQRLTGHPAILKGLLHRGGLRAQILDEGILRVGDAIRPVSK